MRTYSAHDLRVVGNNRDGENGGSAALQDASGKGSHLAFLVRQARSLHVQTPVILQEGGNSQGERYFKRTHKESNKGYHVTCKFLLNVRIVPLSLQEIMLVLYKT